MVVDGQFSRYKYNIIRSKAPQVFPSYKVIQQTKKTCYPSNIITSQTSVSVGLQDLLDHTILRLLHSIDEDLITNLEDQELSLITKWGFDGTTGHTQYKQAFLDYSVSDSHALITALVPLRLCFKDKIIWQNPKPSSTRYCRPLKIKYIKENNDVVIRQKKNIDKQLRKIKLSNISVGHKNFIVKHELHLTMIDVKSCNAITNNNYSQACYICKASNKEFNNIDKMLSLPTSNLEYGLSILHAWIKCYECILHLAYRLPLKKRIAKGECKVSVEITKRKIQEEFKKDCGLHIDKPKPGAGNYNDGNTARRFFQNYEKIFILYWQYYQVPAQ